MDITTPVRTRDWIEKYLTTKKNKHTQSRYRSTLTEFADWMQENNYRLGKNGLPVEVFSLYHDYLTAQGHAPNTVLNKFNQVRNFFDMLKLLGRIENNEAHLIKLEPVTESECDARALTTAEEKRMFKACDKTTAEGQIEYMFVTILLRVAPRSAEIASLRFGDFFKEGARYKVRFKIKRGRIRTVNVDVDTYKRVQAYRKTLGKMRDVEYKDDDLILQGTRDHRPRQKPMNNSAVWKLVQRIATKANVKDISPHSGRATVATKMYDMGCNDKQVMDYMAWRDVTTARKYNKREQETSPSIIKNLAVKE